MLLTNQQQLLLFWYRFWNVVSMGIGSLSAETEIVSAEM
jgi:hypothetical protein